MEPMARFTHLVRQELDSLLTVQSSTRPWQMPLAAALSSGIPLLVGAFFGRMDYGLVSSLGGMVFLYTPASALHQRMATVMACAMGMTACFALGLVGALHPALLVALVTVMTTLVTMVCRLYRMPPPGSLFFVMALIIAAYPPFDLLAIPTRVGLLALGTLVAAGVALLYSLYMLRFAGVAPSAARIWNPPPFDEYGPDAVFIGLTVGLALLLAHLLGLDRPYWVPVSCLAVIQGASLRSVWTKQAQRIAGTAVGLVLTWGLLSLSMNIWIVCATMIALSFVIELLVVRHYGLAVVFITPLTIFLAEASAGMAANTGALIAARFLDIALGSVMGLLGAVLIHHPPSRDLLLRVLQPLARRRAP